MTCRRRAALLVLGVLLGTAGSTPQLGAQWLGGGTTQSAQAAPHGETAPLVTAPEAVVFSIVLTTAFIADESLRGEFGDPSYRPFFYQAGDALGNAAIVLPVLAGGYLIGRGLDNVEMSRAFSNAIFSGLAAGAATLMLKQAIGRVRPDETEDAGQFRPFEGHAALPSGHASYSAAVLTSLVMDSPWRGLRYAAYGGIAACALSRLHYNRHWTSDVVAGAALGVVSARLVSRLRSEHGRVDVTPNGVSLRLFF